MEEGDKLVDLTESTMQCRFYPGVQLVLESITLGLPRKRIVELRNSCNAISAKQKDSRVDQIGLIGLVCSYSVILLGRRCASPLIVWLNEHIFVSACYAKSLVFSSRANADPATRGRCWQ